MKKRFYVIISFCVALLSACVKDTETLPSTEAVFTGNWAVSENSSIYGPGTYNVNITTVNNDTSTVSITYLYGFNTPIKATVSSKTLTIPNQTIEGLPLYGNGTLANAKHLDITYYVNTGSGIDTVKATLTK